MKTIYLILIKFLDLIFYSFFYAYILVAPFVLFIDFNLPFFVGFLSAIFPILNRVKFDTNTFVSTDYLQDEINVIKRKQCIVNYHK